MPQIRSRLCPTRTFLSNPTSTGLRNPGQLSPDSLEAIDPHLNQAMTSPARRMTCPTLPSPSFPWNLCQYRR